MRFIYHLSILLMLLTASAEQALADRGGAHEPLCQFTTGAGHAQTPTDMQRQGIAVYLRSATNIKAFPMGVEYTNQLRQIFGDRIFSCKLTVKPDGSIADLTMFKNSGSAVMDKRAIDFIRTATPFHKMQLTENQTYLIEFPLLTVKKY